MHRSKSYLSIGLIKFNLNLSFFYYSNMNLMLNFHIFIEAKYLKRLSINQSFRMELFSALIIYYNNIFDIVQSGTL